MARRALLLEIGGLFAYVLLRPVLGAGHQLTVAAFAWLLHAIVGTGVWEPLLRTSGLDPIYAGAAIRAAGGVQVAGFAVAGPPGALLHQLFPNVFLGQDHLMGSAAVSMVAAPGAPALGHGLASFSADVFWLAIGVWLFWHWRRRALPVALIGLLLQAQIGVRHLLDARVPLADIDASGLPFALEVAVPNGGWFTNSLASMPAGERGLLVGGSLLIAGYACAAMWVGLGVGVARILNRRRRTSAAPRSAIVGRSLEPRRAGWSSMLNRLPRFGMRGAQPATLRKPRPAQWSTVLISLGLALATAWSPIGALATGNSNWQSATTTALQAAASSAQDASVAPSVPGVPTSVAVEPSTDIAWRYVVDGSGDSIRGVGYNPWYASLPPDQRAALYQRDFSAMHRLGINTIEGWFEGQFDSVTLDAAAANDIGVLMPFELNQDWDYSNPNVQQSILDHVSAYVEQYKDHPAVRMWAPGNENLHRILYAHWVSQANDPTARARASAFAEFLPKLVDRIHELDPNHPVVYRDAEDVYLPWITGAFAAAGGDRPWLVYGANVYSDARLESIVGGWPTQWPGHALLISEFAPGGSGPADRPTGFQHEWQIIRSRPDAVLGGLAYTWATNGPEDLDRVFGLVDPNGVPTDGGLAALSKAYQTTS